MAEHDFSDVRFVGSDEATLLDYWCEHYYPGSGTTPASAEFWVEVQDSLDSDQTVYVYYGFEDTFSASDGPATFLFFDDFESVSTGEHPDSSRWTVYGTEDVNDYTLVELDPAGGSNHVLRCKQGHDGDDNYADTKDIDVTCGVAIGFMWRRDGVSYHSYMSASSPSGTNLLTARFYAASPRRIMTYDGSAYQNLNPNFYWSVNTWYTCEYRLFADDMTYYDGSQSHNGALWTGTYPGLGHFQSFADYKNSIYSGYSDNYYVRKYVPDEPTHGSWGSVEVFC